MLAVQLQPNSICIGMLYAFSAACKDLTCYPPCAGLLPHHLASMPGSDSAEHVLLPHHLWPVATGQCIAVRHKSI